MNKELRKMRLLFAEGGINGYEIRNIVVQYSCKD